MVGPKVPKILNITPDPLVQDKEGQSEALTLEILKTNFG